MPSRARRTHRSAPRKASSRRRRSGAGDPGDPGDPGGPRSDGPRSAGSRSLPVEVDPPEPTADLTPDEEAVLRPGVARVARLRRWGVRGAMALVGVGTLVVFAGVSMSRTAPAWWRPVDASMADDAAIGVENALGTHLTLARPDGEQWRIAIRADDANAWLNTRLNAWLVSQGARSAEDQPLALPDRFRELQVQFDDDRIVIGVRLVGEDGGRDRFLSASLRPSIDDEGRLWLPAERVHVGRLPIPASWALGRANAGGDDLLPPEWRGRDETDVFFRVLSGEVPVPHPAAVRLADGRTVRLIELRTQDSYLAVSCVTGR